MINNLIKIKQLLINIKFKDMKKFFILFLIVFNSIVNFGQTFFSNGLISNGNVSIQNNSAIQLGGFYFVYNSDSIWIENPNGIWFAKITTINNDSSIYSDTADYANKADSNAVTYTSDTGYFNNIYNDRIKADNDSLNLDGLSILYDYSINNKDYKSGNNFDYLGLFDTYNILAYGNNSYRSQLSNFGNHVYLESKTLSDYSYKFDLLYNKAYLIYDTPSAAEDTIYRFNPDSLLAPDIDAKFKSVKSDRIEINGKLLNEKDTSIISYSSINNGDSVLIKSNCDSIIYIDFILMDGDDFDGSGSDQTTLYVYYNNIKTQIAYITESWILSSTDIRQRLFFSASHDIGSPIWIEFGSQFYGGTRNIKLITKNE